MKSVSIRIIALSVVIAAVAGCGGSGSSSSSSGGSPAATTTSSATANYTPPNVEAGIPVTISADKKPFDALVSGTVKYGHRADPFTLTKEEEAYDKDQNAERVMAEMGGFRDEHVEKDDTVVVPYQEPQPYRRLAGIIVGDSVLALVDMGNGQLEVIRPGQKIDRTDWTVVSIDQDKAVLHRDGPIAPHNVTVRLESPPPGMGGGGAGFSGAPTGGPPGGIPGGGGGKRGGPQGAGMAAGG